MKFLCIPIVFALLGLLKTSVSLFLCWYLLSSCFGGNMYVFWSVRCFYVFIVTWNVVQFWLLLWLYFAFVLFNLFVFLGWHMVSFRILSRWYFPISWSQFLGFFYLSLHFRIVWGSFVTFVICATGVAWDFIFVMRRVVCTSYGICIWLLNCSWLLSWF